jgi:hypothetical protein
LTTNPKVILDKTNFDKIVNSEKLSISNDLTDSKVANNVNELLIDFTNLPNLNIKEIKVAQIKNVTFVNIPIEFVKNKDLELFNLEIEGGIQGFSLKTAENKPNVSKFENVSDYNIYDILIFTIILLIVFINRERLMKMIKG